MKINQHGFTIPELLTVLIVTGFFTTLILFFGFSYWRYSYLLEADQDTLTSRLNASDYLRENLGTSSGLITQNSISDSHTLNPDPNIPSNLYWKPLHAIPSSTTLGSGTTPLLYYKRFSFDSSNNYIMNGTQPYEDEFVIYTDNTNKQLMLRALANPSASGDKLKTSCPPPQATSSCPADKVIAQNISSVNLKYFSRSGNTIDYTSSTDPSTGQYNGPDFPVVEVVEVTLHLSKKPVLQQSTATVNQVIIRLAIRNT